MTLEGIEIDFRRKVGDSIRLAMEGLDRYRVFTPFLFEDGDHLAVLLKRDRDGWTLSDEGHTYMHLTYDIDERDLRLGSRQKIVANALSVFSIEDRDGELRLPIPEEKFGDALFSYVQALLKISDVSYLSRERVKSTFIEDFRTFIRSKVSEDRIFFDWSDSIHDPGGKYMVDCRLNGMPRPLMIFALASDHSVQTATISLLQFERWGLPHRSCAIFEDMEVVNRKDHARFTDVCGKMFSSLVVNRDRIAQYINEALSV